MKFLKKIIRGLYRAYPVAYRTRRIQKDAASYYDGMLRHCAYVSKELNQLSFAITKDSFGYPKIRLVQRSDDVKLYESDNCVIVKDGFFYEMTKEAIKDK